MRKGPIILGIGILLVVLALPLALAYTVYDEKTVPSGDFDDDWEGDRIDYMYTLENVGPGKIKISVRSMIFSTVDYHVKIYDDDKDRTLDEYDIEGGSIFWKDRSTDLDHKGDYTIYISVDEDEEYGGDFKASYTSDYAMLGFFSFLLGFPLFLISGLVLIIIGSYSIYKTTLPKEGERGYEEEYTQFGEGYYGLEKEMDNDYYYSYRRREKHYRDRPGYEENVRGGTVGRRRERRTSDRREDEIRRKRGERPPRERSAGPGRKMTEKKRRRPVEDEDEPVKVRKKGPAKDRKKTLKIEEGPVTKKKDHTSKKIRVEKRGDTSKGKRKVPDKVKKGALKKEKTEARKIEEDEMQEFEE